MSDGDGNSDNTGGDAATQEGTPANAPADSGANAKGDPEGAEFLKDAGKKALDSMKEERRKAQTEAKEARDELARIKAEQAGEQEKYEQQKREQQVKDEALAAANERIVKSSVRERAASKLSDPGDALHFIDVSEFAVSDDGTPDTTKIDQAIDGLVEQKPYLAAQSSRRFQGSADGGARNGDAGKVQQFTRDDLAAMTPHQIAQAKYEGRLDQMLGRR